MRGLKGKNVLVTGASSGIGQAIAIRFAEEGANVAVNYYSGEEEADATLEQMRAASAKAGVEPGTLKDIKVQADVSKEDNVASMFEQVIGAFGGLDILVNNAGILESQMRVESMDAARLQRIFKVNVIGSFLCAREAVKRMSTQHGGTGGAIVNVSSVAARLGSPGEYVDYAASKGAIDTLTIGLAKEVANEGIRVNAVRPGFIDTDIHASGGEPNRIERVKALVPLQRGGQAIEVAHAILWLLSTEAAYTTGSFIDVAGGK